MDPLFSSIRLMTDTVRLAKYIADTIPCSRREAEQYIEGGWVQVDGLVVEEPGWRVAPQATVLVSPDARLQPVEPVTILFHKPAGLDIGASQVPEEWITPGSRLPTDRSPLRFLKKHVAGLTVATPLDTLASGLVVLTQEYRITRKLVDDAAKTEHEYLVEVGGNIADGGLDVLNQGRFFKGRPMPAAKVSWQNETRLRFAMKTPPAGLIENMLGAVGLKIVAMKRLRIGRLPVSGLEAGQWRYLLGYERF